MSESRELQSLLGRWHQWRRMWTHERGYARMAYEYASTGDDDEALERLVMQSVDEQVSAMPRELQLALQHVGRAECLGVEVMHHPMLANVQAREALVQRAMRELHGRLLHAGVI